MSRPRPIWVHHGVHLRRNVPLEGAGADEALEALQRTRATRWFLDHQHRFELTPAMRTCVRAIGVGPTGGSVVAAPALESALGLGSGNLLQRLRALSDRLDAEPPIHGVRPRLISVVPGVRCRWQERWMPDGTTVPRSFCLGVEHQTGAGWRFGLDRPYRRRTNLWPAREALVGRQDALRWLDRALAQPGEVTISGPSGIGKSRLAREWAWSQDHLFADGGGVWRWRSGEPAPPDDLELLIVEGSEPGPVARRVIRTVEQVRAGSLQLGPLCHEDAVRLLGVDDARLLAAAAGIPGRLIRARRLLATSEVAEIVALLSPVADRRWLDA